MRKIPYARQYIDREDIAAVTAALRLSNLTQGPMVEKFEKAIAKYCGARYAVAVNSGTSALHIACLAAGIGPGDEVITSPITFAASANCVLYCGGRPVFTDVCDDTVNIDPASIERLINAKTKAIIPVHFAGHPCDMQEIWSTAKKRGLIVIEDAAHALGAAYKGSRVGSCKYSDMTILSFHAVKHITTGEGGMVLTNNPDYYQRLKMLRTHGITRNPSLLMLDQEGSWHYEMQILGFNYRLTDIQCALGISQLKKLPSFLMQRKRIVVAYDKAFSEIEGVKPLKEREYVSSAHHIYVLRFDPEMITLSREKIYNSFIKKGIQVNVHYMPVYWHPYYHRIGYKKGLCPGAENYYKEAITIPLYPKMTAGDIEKVIRATEDIVGGQKR